MLAPHETMIKSSDMVVVLIDAQERLAAAMPERERVLAVMSRVLRAAGILGVPVVATRQYPKGLGPTEAQIESLLLDLADHGSTVIGVDKITFDCTKEPDFMEALGGTFRRQVVIVGMETHICVTQTALSLGGHGYQVQVAADGCCSRDAAAHDVALDRLRAAGVIVTHSESVLYEALGRSGTDQFKAILSIIK